MHDCTVWLLPYSETCQAQNITPAPSKALISREPLHHLVEELVRYSDAPGSILLPRHSFARYQNQHANSAGAWLPPIPYGPRRTGSEGQGCHCCWFHMAQLDRAGSEVGCFMEITCQSFPFQKHNVYQNWHTAASVVSK